MRLRYPRFGVFILTCLCMKIEDQMEIEKLTMEDGRRAKDDHESTKLGKCEKERLLFHPFSLSRFRDSCFALAYSFTSCSE
jgi:hypothetical protein